MEINKLIIYITLILILALYLYISYNYELKKANKEEFNNINVNITDNKKNNKRQNNINNFKDKIDNSNKNMILSKSQFIQPSDNDFKEEWDNIITEYVSEFNNVNLFARGVQSQAELIKKYSQQCLIYISSEDINSVNNMLQTLDNKNPIYPLIQQILPNIRIVKCSTELEFGFPHTHKNIIVFSDEYFQYPSLTTFIHECIHIDQRLRPDVYNKLYSNWGFVQYPINTIKGDEFSSVIIYQSRTNPDGRDINWLWISPTMQAYWIGAVFNSNTPGSIADVENRIYKIENVNAGYNTMDKVGQYTGQSSLIHYNKEFVSYFGRLKNNNYHPNEISAELAVKVFTDAEYSNGSTSSKSEIELASILL
jgi:hypothetical protein